MAGRTTVHRTTVRRTAVYLAPAIVAVECRRTPVAPEARRRFAPWAPRPVRTPAVERPATVVVVPIIAQRKGDDRQAERRAVRVDRHLVRLVRIVEVARIDEAAHVAGVDIAPRIGGDATTDADGRAGRECRDRRMRRVASATYVARARGDRVLRGVVEWQHEHECRNE